jgi:hypothetical protein
MVLPGGASKPEYKYAYMFDAFPPFAAWLPFETAVLWSVATSSFNTCIHSPQS